MIPVAELRERLITLSRNATQCDQLLAELPSDGVILSGEEVAERQELAARIDKLIRDADLTMVVVWQTWALRLLTEASAVLLLRDSAGEETG